MTLNRRDPFCAAEVVNDSSVILLTLSENCDEKTAHEKKTIYTLIGLSNDNICTRSDNDHKSIKNSGNSGYLVIIFDDMQVPSRVEKVKKRFSILAYESLLLFVM